MLVLSSLSPARTRQVDGTPLTLTGFTDQDDDGTVSGPMVLGHNSLTMGDWTITAPDGTDATALLDDSQADAPELDRTAWAGQHGGLWSGKFVDHDGNVGEASFVVGRAHAGSCYVKVYDVDLTDEDAYDFLGGPTALGSPARTWTRQAGGDTANEILAAGAGYRVSLNGAAAAGITTPFATLLGPVSAESSYALLFRAAAAQLAGDQRRGVVEVNDPTTTSSVKAGHKVVVATTRRHVAGQERAGVAWASAAGFTAGDAEVTALVVKGNDVDLRFGAWVAGWPSLDDLSSEQTLAMARGFADGPVWSFDASMTVGLSATRDATAGDWTYTWKGMSAWVVK